MRVQAIIEAAIKAPSGDNCQPWRFEVEGKVIRLINMPDKDTSLYNFRQRASYIAHGAALENMLIASRALGYVAEPSLFPNADNDQLTATVTLRESTELNCPLYSQIPLRGTNRKRYDGTPLSSQERSTLMAVGERSGQGTVKLLDGAEKMALARVICLNDRLVFENRHLHAFLYHQIRWSDQEARETSDGLDIKTLELSLPDAAGFRMLRYWRLMNFLNNFGVARIVAASAQKLAESASAIGIITMPGSNPVDYLNAGRIMQHLWLEATRLNLSFQLMTGITFLMRRLRDEEPGPVAPRQVNLIREAARTITGLCSLADETVMVIFRVGRSTPPSARSLRLPLEQSVSWIG